MGALIFRCNGADEQSLSRRNLFTSPTEQLGRDTGPADVLFDRETERGHARTVQEADSIAIQWRRVEQHVGCGVDSGREHDGRDREARLAVQGICIYLK
ncbi:hypothetical protein CGRA01v4_00453 [Colletotrichum graminicola]|nr:hypothetical protein CGRA01v4_00453 [Colletotrichum graminicola]